MITTIATIVGIVAETMAIAEEIIKNSELMKSSLSVVVRQLGQKN